MPKGFLKTILLGNRLDYLNNKRDPFRLKTQDPNLMRSHLKISLKSFKNLLTIHAEDMKLIVDAILRRSHWELFLRSLEYLLSKSFWDLMKTQKDFLKIYKKINRRFYKKIFRRSSVHFWQFDEFFRFFFKLKIKKKTRSSVDLKKISDEDLLKISKRFELKIFQRSSRDFSWRSFKDFKKILGRNCLKIFQRKLM